MKQVPSYIPRTPRRSAEGLYVYSRAKKFPIGDLYHARTALVFALSPSNASKRAKVLKAVAQAYPQYNWSAWWNSKRKGKKGIKTWSQIVGKTTQRRVANPKKVGVLYAEDLADGYTSKVSVSSEKTLYYLKKLTILGEPEAGESFKDWYDTRVHIAIGSVKAKNIKNLSKAIQEQGFYDKSSTAVYREKKNLEDAFYQGQIYRNPRKRKNTAKRRNSAQRYYLLTKYPEENFWTSSLEPSMGNETFTKAEAEAERRILKHRSNIEVRILKVPKDTKKTSSKNPRKRKNPSRTFHFYSDPGHGWLKVPLKLLKELGITNKISHYSYLRGDYGYLEEDRDAQILLQALKDQGIEVKIRPHYASKSSRIRNYRSFPKRRNPSPVKNTRRRTRKYSLRKKKKGKR